MNVSLGQLRTWLHRTASAIRRRAAIVAALLSALTLPLLTAACLMDSDAASAGSPHGDSAALAGPVARLCEAISACDADEFARAFESLRECEQVLLETVTSLYTIADPTCEQAIEDALSCLSSLRCVELAEYHSGDRRWCELELDTVDARCLDE